MKTNIKHIIRPITALPLLVGLAITYGLLLSALPTKSRAHSALRTPHSALGMPSSPACGTEWDVISSPNIEQAGNNDLNAIDAVTSDDIWAVGSYLSSSGSGGRNRTLAMHWDGAAWSIVPSPNGNAENNHLYGVAALSPTDVWAVGYYRFATPTLVDKTLIMHWDGGAWNIVPSPNVGTSDNNLYAIVALAANDIWAVGRYRVSGTDYPSLILHYDGTAWVVVTSPNVPGAASNNLYAITALAPNNIWAAGSFRANNVDQTLAMHYNGVNWSIVTTPNVGADNNVFNSISAVSADDVWAVGRYRNVARVNQTLTARWNGTEWSVVSSPNVGSTNNELFATVALGANDVWAVGQYRSGVYKTLAQHFDGTEWGVIPSVSAGTGDNNLRAISALSNDEIWASGYFTSTGVPHQTLVERFNTCGTPIVTSTPFGPTRTRTPTPVLTSTETPTPGTGPTDTPTATAGTGSRTSTRTATHTRTPVVGTPTTTPTPGGEETETPTPEASPVEGTLTPTPDGTSTPEGTPTQCAMDFTDVQPDDYFYESVQYLYCNGAISGYGDNTFRPYNNTTRGQICKIVVLAEGWPIDITGGQIFTDVPPYNVFYSYIMTAYNRGVISGYSDGMFRWTNNITRAQLSKVIVLAQEWPIETDGGPHFSDVPEDHSFYGYIETIFNHNAISGYADGTFRPYTNATRGQICKIVYQAITEP